MPKFQFTMRRSWDAPDEPIPAANLTAEVFHAKQLSQAKHAAYNRAYMREWRKTHPLTDEQKRKDRCRSYAKVYLKRGKLTREPCVVCGNDAAQMHHPDYGEPLDVVWLCRKHHLDLHKMGL
jgi:hypothetical protein